MHAMLPKGGAGQNREEYIAEANNFVLTRIGRARDFAAHGRREEAFEVLGSAMHTMQDSTSPVHRGFQEYKYDHPLDAYNKHVAKENRYPELGTRERIELDGATRWTYDMFTGAAGIPDRVFDLESGLLLLPDKYKQRP